MKLGAICFLTEYSISPAELGRELENHGFESLWVGDHSHIAIEPGTSAPLDTRTGQPVPTHYSHLMDPFLALTHAAATTHRIRLGTSICLVNERDPITTAKAVATLDCLSGGRFFFGVGAGWNAQEMRDHGTDPSTRLPLLKERLAAMKQIWTEDVAEYQGDLVQFGPMMCWPKPIQKPYPPIFLGGNFKNIPRVVDYADGWIPSTTVAPARAFLDKIGELQRQAEAAGRGPLPVTAVYVTDVDRLADGEGVFTDQQWDEYETAGVDRVVLMLPPDRKAALQLAERYARFAER
ncbi:MAG: hypothetical protein QOG64_3020 [Acidimicrobiaceae bacterium]|nr:hypothetical protein [Acidimicrobiaceae bacterium]